MDVAYGILGALIIFGIGCFVFYTVVYAITSAYYQAKTLHNKPSPMNFTLTLPPGTLSLFREFVNDYHNKVSMQRADRDGKNR